LRSGAPAQFQRKSTGVLLKRFVRLKAGEKSRPGKAEKAIAMSCLGKQKKKESRKRNLET